jgi:hypothetical protein
VINEVLYDALSQPDGDGEWAELYNRGDRAVNIGGWALEDASGIDVLPPLVVPARGYAVVAASDAFTSAYPEYTGALALAGRIGNGLGNDGDRLALVRPDGVLVDAISWGTDTSARDPSITDVPEGHSIERRTPGGDRDASDDFADNEQPSPGRAYAPPAPRKATSNSVEILNGQPDRSFGWLPWALASASGAALAGTLAWRVVESARPRPPRT